MACLFFHKYSKSAFIDLTTCRRHYHLMDHPRIRCFPGKLQSLYQVCHTWIHYYYHHQYRNKMQVWYLVILCWGVFLLTCSLDINCKLKKILQQRGEVVCCLFALAEISWEHLTSFFTFLFQRHKPFRHCEASPHNNRRQICSSDPLINQTFHRLGGVDLLVFRGTEHYEKKRMAWVVGPC